MGCFAALEASRVADLPIPILGAAETLADLRATDFDPAALGEGGPAVEHLDQLAREHLLGAR